MSRGRILTVLVALLAVSVLAWVQVAAAAPGETVSVNRARISTDLGHKFTFRSTIVNGGHAAAHGLIAHLNIVGLDPSVYVDPEDWSSHRTIYLDTLPAGGSKTITWHLQAVSAGKFDVYVAVFSRRAIATAPTTGAAIRVAVADRRTLNSGGIVPLALGVPAFLGLLAFSVRVKRRRRPSPKA
jgi:hypothetical protein